VALRSGELKEDDEGNPFYNLWREPWWPESVREGGGSSLVSGRWCRISSGRGSARIEVAVHRG
jgi:hypothetical protein